MVCLKVQPKSFVGDEIIHMAVSTHPQKRLPINNLLLRALRCLNPRAGVSRYIAELQSCCQGKAQHWARRGDLGWRSVGKVSRNASETR